MVGITGIGGRFGRANTIKESQGATTGNYDGDASSFSNADNSTVAQKQKERVYTAKERITSKKEH